MRGSKHINVEADLADLSKFEGTIRLGIIFLFMSVTTAQLIMFFLYHVGTGEMVSQDVEDISTSVFSSDPTLIFSFDA